MCMCVCLHMQCLLHVCYFLHNCVDMLGRCVCLCVCVCTFRCVCVCMFRCVYACVCVYASMCVCIHVCVLVEAFSTASQLLGVCLSVQSCRMMVLLYHSGPKVKFFQTKEGREREAE